MNTIQLIGNLTADPDLRETTGGKKVGTLRLAVNRRDRTTDPVYIDVKVWERLAETCAQHLTRGRQVAVTGRLDYQEWQADEGQRRSKHEVIADNVEFLDRPKTDNGN